MSLPELRIMAATDTIISSPNVAAQNELSINLSQAQNLRVSMDQSKLSAQPMQAKLPQQLQIPKPNISLTTVNVVDVTTGSGGGVGQNDNIQSNGIFLAKSGSTKTLQSQSQSPQGNQKSNLYSVLKLTPQQLNQLKLAPYIKNSLNPAVIINHQGFASMKNKKQIFGVAQSRIEDTNGYKVKLQMVDENGQPTNSSRKQQHHNIQGGNSRNNTHNSHHKTTTTTTTTEKHGTAVHHHHHHHHHQKLSVTQIQVSSDEYFTHSISEPRVEQKAEEILNAAASSIERENDISLPNINKQRHVLVVETSSPRNSGTNSGAQQAINSALRASEVAFAYRSMLKNSVVGGTSPAGIVIGSTNQSQFVTQTDPMAAVTPNLTSAMQYNQQQNSESFLNPPSGAVNTATVQSSEQQIVSSFENGNQRQQSVTLQIVNAQINTTCNSPLQSSYQIAQDGSGSTSSKNLKQKRIMNKLKSIPESLQINQIQSRAIAAASQANQTSPYQNQFKSSTGDQAIKKSKNQLEQQNQSIQSIQQANSMSTGALNRALGALHSQNENDDSKQQDTIGGFDGDEQQYYQDEFEDALPSQLNRKEEVKCESQPSDSHTVQRGNRKRKQQLKQHTQETINVTKAKLSKGTFELAPILDSQKPLNITAEEPHTKFPSINMRIQQVVPANDFSNSHIARGRKQTQEDSSVQEKKEAANKRNDLKSPEGVINDARSFQLKHIPASTKSIQSLYGGHNFNSRSQSGTAALNGQVSQSSLLQKKVKQNNFYASTDKTSKNLVEQAAASSVKHSYSSNQTLIQNHSHAQQTLINKKKYSLPLLGINEELPPKQVIQLGPTKEEITVKIIQTVDPQQLEVKKSEDIEKGSEFVTAAEKDESVFAEFLRNHLNKFNNALSTTAPSEIHDIFKVSNDITGTTDTTYTCDLQLKLNVVISELFSGNFNLVKSIVEQLKNTIKLLKEKWELLGGGPVPPQKKAKAKKTPKEHPSAQNIIIQDVDKTLLSSPQKDDDKINISVQAEESNRLELKPLVLDNDKEENRSITKNALNSNELSAPDSQNSSVATSPDRKTKARAAMKSKILSMARLMNESVGNTPASKSKSAKVSSVNIVEAVSQNDILPPLLQTSISVYATASAAKTDEIDQGSATLIKESIVYDHKKPPLAKGDTKETTLSKQNTLRSNQTNEQSTSSKQNIAAAKAKAKNATQFLSAISHKSVSTKEAIYHSFDQREESKGNDNLSPMQSEKNKKPTLQIRQSDNDDDLVMKNARKNKMQMLITMAKEAKTSEMSGISHSLNNDDTPNVCQDSIAFPSDEQKPQAQSSTSLCGVITGDNQSLECGPINGDQTPKEIENRINGIPSKLLARRANQGKAGIQPEVQQITISIEGPKPEPSQQKAEVDQNQQEPQKQINSNRSNKSHHAESNSALGVHRRVSGQAFFNELVDVLNIVAQTQEMEIEIDRIPEEDEICIEDHKEEQKHEKLVKSDHDDVQYLNTQRTQEAEQLKMRRTAGFFNTTDDIKIVFNENFLLQGPGLIQKSEEDRLYELPVNLNLMSSDTMDIQNAINRHSYDDTSQNTRSDLDFDHMSSNTHKRYSRSLKTKKSIISRHSQLQKAQRLLEKQQLMKEIQERKLKEAEKFDSQLHNIHTKFVHAHQNHSKLLQKKELISLKAIKEAEEEAPLTGAYSTNDLLALFPDEDFTYKRPEKPQKHFDIHNDETEI